MAALRMLNTLRRVPARLLLLLVAVLGTAAGLVAAPAAPPLDATAAARSELKTLHDESLRRRAVWTLLQAERYAQMRYQQKLGPVLGSAHDIYGDILFATPTRISRVFDLGDQLIAVQERVLHRWAIDGRPLAPASLTNIDLYNLDLSSDAKVLGVADANHGAAQTRLGIVSTADGSTTLESTVSGLPMGDVVVAEDGHAVAMSLQPLAPSPGQAGRPPGVVVLARDGNRSRTLPDLHRAVALGPGAAWLIAHSLEQGHPLYLLSEGSRSKLRHAAAAAGIAVIVDDTGTLRFLRGDGSSAPWTPTGFPLGTQGVRPHACDGWLMLQSGSGATGAQRRNLIDDPVGAAEIIPPRVAFWRFADLARARDAAPQFVLPDQGPQICRMFPSAIYRWDNATLSVLDLPSVAALPASIAAFASPATVPTARNVLTAAAPIERVDDRMHRLAIRLRNATWLVTDPIGRVLWEGATEQCRVIDRDYAVLIDGANPKSTYRVVSLNLDPAKRPMITLDLPEGSWEIRASSIDRRVYATRWVTIAGVSHEDWIEFDLATGAVKAVLPPGSNQRRHAAQRDDSYGRWYLGEARLFSKFHGDTALPPAERLRPYDAWRVGPPGGPGAGLIIDDDRHVRVAIGKNPPPGQRANTWLDLGVVAGANRFGVRRDGIFLVTVGDAAISALVAGPKLDPANASGFVPALPPGPWRVDGMRLTPPNMPTVEWDAGCGIRPLRLRSPEPTGLLVITHSVVIDLWDVAGLKMLVRQP